MRECGLKYLIQKMLWCLLVSLPMRECGLKFESNRALDTRRNVAPHAGVWIEILIYSSFTNPLFVAPHAGVWIEM